MMNDGKKKPKQLVKYDPQCARKTWLYTNSLLRGKKTPPFWSVLQK